MNLICGAHMVILLVGQVDPPVPADTESRLAFMKKSVESYKLRSEDGARTFRLEPEPVLRWSNPVSGNQDGTVYLWTEGGRPVASVQAFNLATGGWLHEFSSLSTGRVVAELRGQPVWYPERAGVVYQAVPDAPKPADTAPKRLRQMQSLVRQFTVEDRFEGKPWEPLRMMTKPLARYGKPQTDVLDGALFCFALGTDPEVFLLLEARNGKDGPAWHFGLAPMTAYEVKVSLKGKPVWSLVARPFPKDPLLPFCNRRYYLE